MTKKMKIKIGIDVGGTFTHAVAVNILDYSVIDKACVATTHKAAEGVAAGVVESMKMLLDSGKFSKEDVIMIAHSTTQATNALLEGDVAPVGVLAMGYGLEGSIGRRQLENDVIQLSETKTLPMFHRFLDLKSGLSEDMIRNALNELKSEGAQVFVATEIFGVDHPENEEMVLKVAAEMNVPASSASSISKLYGLRVRTRTAVINASMMPKMLETANMTEKAIRESGLNVPLMIMRSDGGIMDINEMRKRPILTMLSGPAAGVAAALMYVKISDGIFLEVGGTSTDISVIKNGKPQVKSAQIGGNRLFLRTLDVRTIGIAGGSVPRIKNDRIHEVGPRSAHIAELSYPAFSAIDDFREMKLETFAPRPDDPSDYLRINIPGKEEKYTLTPTECSEYLGLVKVEGHGKSNKTAIISVMLSLAKLIDAEPRELAKDLLEKATDKVKPVIDRLIREYKLERNMVSFVGGGGGASAIVPWSARSMGFQHIIAENTEVISAIGAALGIIQDSVERSVTEPAESDILSIRREAMDSVTAMGADPETVEVQVEFDNKEKKLIATARGNSELRTRDAEVRQYSKKDIIPHAAGLTGLPEEAFKLTASVRRFFVLQNTLSEAYFFQLFRRRTEQIRVFDNEGVIRLQLQNAAIRECPVRSLKSEIKNTLSELTNYGDAGALIPDIYILAASKMLDLTGMMNEQQLFALLDIELNEQDPADDAIIIAAGKK